MTNHVGRPKGATGKYKHPITLEPLGVYAYRRVITKLRPIFQHTNLYQEHKEYYKQYNLTHKEQKRLNYLKNKSKTSVLTP